LHTKKQEVSNLFRNRTNIQLLHIKINRVRQYVRIIIFDLIFQVEIDNKKILDQIIVVVPFNYSLLLENKKKMVPLAYLLFNIALVNMILDQ